MAGDLSWLAKEREARGLSQGALARKVGVSQPSLSKWETGRAAGQGSVLKVAEALEMDPDLALVRSGYTPDWLQKKLKDNPELLGQLKNARK